MNDEIKEILNQLEIVSIKHTIEVCEDGSKIETMPASVVDELRLNNYSAKLLLDYITNLQEENEKAMRTMTLQNAILEERNDTIDYYKTIVNKAIEYLTSYESISTIQGLDNIEKNKQLDENTMNIMTSRYLDVHHNLLNILKGSDE